MLNSLKKEIKNIESLSIFIENNYSLLIEFFLNKSRLELIPLKNDIKSIILLNKKSITALDASYENNINFLSVIAKTLSRLSLFMEFTIIFNTIKDKADKDILIINEYVDIKKISDAFGFNKNISNKYIDENFSDNKKANEFLLNYYLYLVLFFESESLINDFKEKIKKLTKLDKQLFDKVFNVNASLDFKDRELSILSIFDSHNFINTLNQKDQEIAILKEEKQQLSNSLKSNQTSNEVDITPAVAEVQSSDNSFKRTEEQLDIINISKTMQTGQVLIVDALAGCTKTSTLEMITTDNPNSIFLYLAFNKKIVEEAKRRFPKNTEVRTLHALAYKYEVKNKSLVEENYFDRIIADEFEVSVSKDRYLINDIKKEYRHFCLSEYSINELDKFVKERKKEIKKFYEHKKQDRSEYFISRLLESVKYIEKIWNYMCGSNITTHDTYLKMFVENMDTYAINYDFVVLDEAQDVSRLLGKFIINSILSGKYKVIIVGDNNQKIYGFLGNVSLSRIIRRILDNSVYIDKNLTRTFRFSPDTPIENNTNLILNMRNISIIGAKLITNDALDHIESQAFLSRSKMAVLNKATEFIEKGADFNLFMEKSDFDIDVIIDLYDLYRYTMIMKKVLIEKNKLEKDDLAKIDTIPRVKTKFFDIKTGKTYQDYVIKKVINIFRENKDNTIIPAFKNKKFNGISSIYEFEYGAQENVVSDDLENLKICYFVIARFNFFNYFHSNIQYAHIVDKALSILLQEKSNKTSNTFISTIHKVKGLEFEEVTLIDSLTTVRETNPSIDDDHIKTIGGAPGIIGLCGETEKNCKCIKQIDDENKEEKSVSTIIENYKAKIITTKNTIDFSNIDETKKVGLEEIKESANDVEAINKFLCFNVNEENIQEEYNILYVGITRAEKIININNGKYRDTLRFLSFIKENKNEIYNIINNRESDLLVYNKIKKTKGIVFNASFFIAKKCLKEFVASFENYS